MDDVEPPLLKKSSETLPHSVVEGESSQRMTGQAGITTPDGPRFHDLIRRRCSHRVVYVDHCDLVAKCGQRSREVVHRVLHSTGAAGGDGECAGAHHADA
jgi:hypothetical protein